MSIILSSCRKELTPFAETPSQEDQTALNWQPINTIEEDILELATNLNNSTLYFIARDPVQGTTKLYTYSYPTSTFKKSLYYKVTLLEPWLNQDIMIIGANSTSYALSSYQESSNLIGNHVFNMNNSGAILDLIARPDGLYFCGTFTELNSDALFDYVEKLDVVNGAPPAGMAGIESSGNTIDFINNEILIGGQNLNAAGDDILAWDGTAWNQTSFFQSDPEAIVTDMVFYNDTFFTCGKMTSTSKSIQKNKNGETSYCQDLVTYGPQQTFVKFISYNNELYVYGTIRRPNNNPVENGLFKYQNGLWKQIGNNLSDITDVAFFKGYVYAISNGKMYRKIL